MVEALTDEERRVVTVLFADIVGFTSLAERRDPEQVKRLVDAAFALLVADVEAHGGVVDKVLGDAIVALFGAPVAHEDDADRAVRAALAMQATLRDFREEHPADEVRMRIGVNTGEVLGRHGRRHRLHGDGRRRQHRRPAPAAGAARRRAGGRRHTQRCARRACASGPYEDVQLRGRDQEVRVWQAVGHDSALLARRWQSDVPFVGRNTELDVLSNLASISVGGRSAIVAVTGEPGIGKSRLVARGGDDDDGRARPTRSCWRACAPRTASRTCGGRWPAACWARLGLDRNSPADEARDRVVRRLEPFEEFGQGSPEFDHVVEVVMHLLGHPSAIDALGPSAVRDAVFGGLTFALRRRATKSPVVLWIDDLQWAARCCSTCSSRSPATWSDLPLLIITTYRRDDEGITDWPQAVDPALTLHLPLAPLSESEVVDLVHTAAGRPLPERDGAVDLGARRRQPVVPHRARPAGGRVPRRSRRARAAGVAAGADRGPARSAHADRSAAILDNAAILGVEGRVASLRSFAGELGQPFDVTDVDVLVELGLIVRDGGRWQFRSPTSCARSPTARSPSRPGRSATPVSPATWRQLGDLLLDQRAHHLACAAELVAEIGPTPGVPRDVAAKQAITLLLQAARGWYQQGAHRRGLAGDRAGAGARARRRHAAGGAAADGRGSGRDAGAATGPRRVGRRASNRLPPSAIVSPRAEALRLRGTASQMEGDLVAARRDLGRAVGELRELGDQVHLGEALRARGFAEVFGGSLGDAEWFLGEADARLRRRSVTCAAGPGCSSTWRGCRSSPATMPSRSGGCTSAIESFEQLGDRSGVTWARGLLAYVHHFGRRNTEAEALAERRARGGASLGRRVGRGDDAQPQASIRLWSGDIDTARTLADKALAGFRRIDDRFGIIQALGTLNRALVASGRSADAERSVEEIMVLADAFGEMAYPVMAAAGTAMHLGKGRRAAELAAEAARHLDMTGANVDESQVVSAFGELLAGSADDALAVLLDVDVDVSPFALAARATAHAMLGDDKAALADVHAVEALAEEPDSNVSYWDLWIARIAGAACATGGEAEARIAALRSGIDTLGDVVVRATRAMCSAAWTATPRLRRRRADGPTSPPRSSPPDRRRPRTQPPRVGGRMSAMSPFDQPPSSPPVSFDQPPNGGGRRSRRRTAAVAAASVGLAAAGVVAVAQFASADDSGPAAGQRRGPGRRGASGTGSHHRARRGARHGDDQIVIRLGDEEPIVIDLGDLGLPPELGDLSELGELGELGDLQDLDFEQVQKCLGGSLFDLDLDAVPGSLPPLGGFDVFGDDVTLAGPDGVSVLDFGEGDGSVTITRENGELTITSEGDVDVQQLTRSSTRCRTMCLPSGRCRRCPTSTRSSSASKRRASAPATERSRQATTPGGYLLSGYRPAVGYFLTGCLVTRRYGFCSSQPSGNSSLASSLETAGTMITSSPSFQLAGVATLLLAVSCSESITRRISSKLRPVDAG